MTGIGSKGFSMTSWGWVGGRRLWKISDDKFSVFPVFFATWSQGSTQAMDEWFDYTNQLIEDEAEPQGPMILCATDLFELEPRPPQEAS